MKNNTLLFSSLYSNSLPSAAYKITLAEKITVNAKSIQKRFLLMPLMVLGFLFTNANLWGQAGFFGGGTAGMVTYSLNGAGDVNSWNWNTNIGSARSLILKGGYAHTYKGVNGNVCNAKIFYRVYPNGSPSGNFTQLSTMSFNANHTFPAVTATPSNISSSNSGDQRWLISGQTIDLTALATSRGTWVLEVYFQADGNTGANSGCNTNALTDNNGGNNYKILFDKEINPGFEATTVLNNGWDLEISFSQPTWSMDTGIKRSGSNSLAATTTTGNARYAAHKNYLVKVPVSGTNYVHALGYFRRGATLSGTPAVTMQVRTGVSTTSGTPTTSTTSFQRGTVSVAATNGATYFPRFSISGSSNATYYLDDVIIYTSTSSGVDISEPNAPSSLSITRTSTGNNLSWIDGTDDATNTSGIEGTLILRTTTDKTAALTNLNNALLNQAYYSTTSTLGPTTISDGTNIWTVVSNGTSSGSYTDTGAATNVTYVVVMRDKAYNYSAGVSAFSHCVNPTVGGTISIAQTICLNGDPAAFTSSLPTGHTGTLEYKWQSSTTSGSTGFSDIGGATSDTYDAGAISQTTWYKRLARVSCMSDWTGAAESNVLKVSVDESNSAASTYNGGWSSGQDDGVTGFNSWVIPVPIGNAGHGSASAGSDINSLDGDSWFMFADGSGALSQATRPLTNSMSVGNTLTFHIDNGGVVGTVGFSLRRSGANLMELYFVGGGSFYTLNDGTSTLTTNIPYTTSGLRVAITYTNASSPGAYSITVTNLSDGKNYFYSNRSFFTVSGVAPNEIRFFNSNAGAFSNFYINRLSLNRPVINSETNFATQTICSSATAAELSVTASGTELSYKWYSNTSASTSGATDTGVTSTNYTPPSTVGTRFYYCVVTGTCSSVQSNYVQVTVQSAPDSAGSNGTILLCSGTPLTTTLLYNSLTGSPAIGGTWLPEIPTSGSVAGIYTYTQSASSPCSVNTSTVTVSESQTVIWNGNNWSPNTPDSTNSILFSGAFTSTEDIQACSLTVTNNATVIIDGHKVTLSGALVTDSGSSITFNNNSMLLQTGSGYTNSGVINFKKSSSPIFRLDYTLWTSPVLGQNLFNFSPLTLTNRFYTYNETTNFYTSNDVYTPGNPGLNSGSNFLIGRGYLVRSPNNWVSNTGTAAPWTGTFTGVPNTGDIAITISKSSGANYGYNAVGNPYPSPISIADFLNDNSNIINSTLWFWRKTNGVSGSAYITFSNGTYSSGPENNYNIQPGQGFFVKAHNNGFLQFKNTQRIGTNGRFFRYNVQTNNVDAGRYWLNLFNNDILVGNLAIAYKDGATNDFDVDFDGEYINDSQMALTSYISGKELAVQHRATPFSNTDVVPLSFKTDLAGTFTIGFNGSDGVLSSQDIYLEDLLLGQSIAIKTTPYTFVSEAGNFTDRFRITYVNNALGTNNAVFNANQVIVYKDELNDLVVNSGNVIMTCIKVFDVRGRLVQKLINVNATEANISCGSANEMLLIQVTSQDNISVIKKIVK
ncbi:hypothetical protein [Flavobacterium sp.]|jgi:hypothetical protein|uniref:hypothetical protein n=1 Tax=Flavobacterium sp. TaxID=239 RepID=UPI0037838A53